MNPFGLTLCMVSVLFGSAWVIALALRAAVLSFVALYWHGTELKAHFFECATGNCPLKDDKLHFAIELFLTRAMLPGKPTSLDYLLLPIPIFFFSLLQPATALREARGF